MMYVYQNEHVGDWIRVKPSVPSRKYGWKDVTSTNVGIIYI